MAHRKAKSLQPSASSTCRDLYLHMLQILVAADVYPEPDVEELASIIMEHGLTNGHKDQRYRGEDWPQLRMRQLGGLDA